MLNVPASDSGLRFLLASGLSIPLVAVMLAALAAAAPPRGEYGTAVP